MFSFFVRSLSLSRDCIFRISPSLARGILFSLASFAGSDRAAEKKHRTASWRSGWESYWEGHQCISTRYLLSIELLLLYCKMISTMKCIFRSFDFCIQAWNVSNLASRSCWDWTLCIYFSRQDKCFSPGKLQWSEHKKPCSSRRSVKLPQILNWRS